MEFGSNEFKQWLTEQKKTLYEQPQQCMCPNCTEMAISSHVMQKGDILSSIAPNRHLYYIEPHYFSKLPLKYNRVGINKVMTFDGFCNQHDTSIFKPIEVPNVDWRSNEAQFLISYRTLCRELRQQDLTFEFDDSLLKNIVSLNDEMGFIESAFEHLSKLDVGRKILRIVKTDLEQGIFNKDYSMLDFTTIALPYKLELCISTVNEHYDGDVTKCIRITNIFPYKESTIIIIGHSKRYGRLFSKGLTHQLSMNDPYTTSQVLSNLIIYCAGCHCLSEDLYNSLSNETKEQVITEFVNTLDYSAELFQNTNNNFLQQHVLEKSKNKSIIYL